MFKFITNKATLFSTVVLIVALLVNIKSCKQNKEIKELSLENNLMKTELALNHLNISDLEDSLQTFRSEIYKLKVSEDNNKIPDNTHTIVRYTSDSSLRTKLQNLQRQYDSSIDSLAAQRDRERTQRRLLEAYCDSLATQSQTVDSLLNYTTSWPLYVQGEDAPWYGINATIYKDSTYFDVWFAEDYSIFHQTYKKGIWPFRKKQHQVIVSSKNPYKVNQEAQTYLIKN